MSWFGCESKAGRQYQMTVALEMAGYVLIVFGEMKYIHAHHPVGPVLYLLAALPSVPIVGVIAAMGIYLRDEQDEYQRHVTICSILWGTAAAMAWSAFQSFLVSFGWQGTVSPFTTFILFCVMMAVAKLVYRIKDRTGRDE